MKTGTTPPRVVRDTGTKIDLGDIIVWILVGVFAGIPMTAISTFGLWYQSDTALGYAIFFLGCAVMMKFFSHGAVSGLVASVYTVTLMSGLWMHNVPLLVAVSIAAIGWEAYQFTKRKKNPKQED